MKPKYTEFVETILDSIADGVFTIDRGNVITSFNKAAERITGYTKEEAVGRFCYDIFRANICQGACALEEALHTERDVVDRQLNIINREGATIPISVSASVLKDKNGNAIGGVETFRDLSAIEALKKEISDKYTFEDIISKNSGIQKIFNILPDIAESDATVLIEGPSGSGKELFARALHNLSPRRDNPYIVVNCGVLPENLFESELFGYMKGAFTDAVKDKPGRFALAEGGTIFLDEIGDISGISQVKLLRAIQEKEYEPLGAVKTVKANVRVITATNKPLTKLVSEGKFRQDLYYRLNVVRLELPPLSRRREDIPLLVDHFIRLFNLKRGKNITGVSDEVIRVLMHYPFEGNVRELENALEHAFVICHGTRIELEHLPLEMLNFKPGLNTPSASPLDDAEAQALRAALERNSNNRTVTARELGISYTTLWRKMKKLGIN
ncbi:MAG: sigma 54-interacting transcriptional regulator [bacterium]